MTKQRILIVADEIITINIILDILDNEYKVVIAKTGKHALDIVEKVAVDLVLLDVILSDMSGYDVCRQLLQLPHCSHLPVVFVTAMGNEKYEFKGLEVGAIDYISKPFHPSLFRRRVRNHLRMRKSMLELERLNTIAFNANPLTGLPGNNSIREEITRALKNRSKVTVIYIDLDNFKALNDIYGFARGDKVIQFTSDLLKQAAAMSPNCFIGHIGGDDFVLLVPSDRLESIATYIIEEFDRGIVSFYDASHLEKGYVETKDRAGKNVTYPIMSISLGAVDLGRGNYDQYIEVNDGCAEVKKQCKKMVGSKLFVDKRGADEGGTR